MQNKVKTHQKTREKDLIHQTDGAWCLVPNRSIYALILLTKLSELITEGNVDVRDQTIKCQKQPRPSGLPECGEIERWVSRASGEECQRRLWHFGDDRGTRPSLTTIHTPVHSHKYKVVWEAVTNWTWPNSGTSGGENTATFLSDSFFIGNGVGSIGLSLTAAEFGGGNDDVLWAALSWMKWYQFTRLWEGQPLTCGGCCAISERGFAAAASLADLSQSSWALRVAALQLIPNCSRPSLDSVRFLQEEQARLKAVPGYEGSAAPTARASPLAPLFTFNYVIVLLPQKTQDMRRKTSEPRSAECATIISDAKDMKLLPGEEARSADRAPTTVNIRQ
ncbi:hypothetical protein B0H14DRAFT_2590854 [Mycena olivaceomarginata]|nr:hypothetical protein B0H14DRAFT_2590854 [Mycena olivaceomarginata]